MEKWKNSIVVIVVRKISDVLNDSDADHTQPLARVFFSSQNLSDVCCKALENQALSLGQSLPTRCRSFPVSTPVSSPLT